MYIMTKNNKNNACNDDDNCYNDNDHDITNTQTI